MKSVSTVWTVLIWYVAIAAASSRTDYRIGSQAQNERQHFLNDFPHQNDTSVPPVEGDPLASCQRRCGIRGHNEKLPCQCNMACVEFNDCCPDFEKVCKSCRGRCFSKHSRTAPCQCNSQCERHNNCCDDFVLCKKEGVTRAELAALSEELLSLDVNNVAPLIETDLQGSTSAGGASDRAPNPLLVVGKEIYDDGNSTLSKLLQLHNNYEAAVGIPEEVTSEEVEEETQFLDAIMSTPIMKRTEAFMTEKNLIPGNRNFREALKEIWFGLYSRAGNILGSSGFEHIFLGELKKGVSGFHNWAYFASEERKGNLNYKGYISQLSLGSKGMIISHNFEWRGQKKPVSSMWIGTSPEFELAIYTICWYVRPSRSSGSCPIVLNGNKLSIQTYTISRNGINYVAAAYPVI